VVVESSLKRVLGVIGRVYLMIVRGFGGYKICTLQANRFFVHFYTFPHWGLQIKFAVLFFLFEGVPKYFGDFK